MRFVVEHHADIETYAVVDTHSPVPNGTQMVVFCTTDETEARTTCDQMERWSKAGFRKIIVDGHRPRPAI